MHDLFVAGVSNVFLERPSAKAIGLATKALNVFTFETAIDAVLMEQQALDTTV